MLFGVLLGACVRGVGYVLPLPRPWRLGLVAIFFVALIALAIWWAITSLAAEFGSLYAVINEQVTYLHDRAKNLGLPVNAAIGDADNMLDVVLGYAGTVLGHAGRALSFGLGALANLVIIFIAGLFLAANPSSLPRRYRPVFSLTSAVDSARDA
jgi:predicted PurR-regulated permease PerM